MTDVTDDKQDVATTPEKKSDADNNSSEAGQVSKEIGGPKGLEPTRYGDWEKAGRCIDF